MTAADSSPLMASHMLLADQLPADRQFQPPSSTRPSATIRQRRTIPPGTVADGNFGFRSWISRTRCLRDGFLTSGRPRQTMKEQAIRWRSGCSIFGNLARETVLDATLRRMARPGCSCACWTRRASDCLLLRQLTIRSARNRWARYLQMLGRFGTIKSNRLVESGGRLFVVYEATVASGPPTNNLEQRDAEVIAITRYGKLLFAWCWTAPTMSELMQVPNSQAQFGSSPPIAVGPGMLTWRTTSRP